MRLLFFALISFLGIQASAAPANLRVCFHENINYGGSFFCATGTPTVAALPNGWNDRISSVRITGPALVVLYQDVNFGGQHLRLTSSTPDIRNLGGAQWNDFASSYQIVRNASGGGGSAPAQVCYYADINFTGAHFCLGRGQEFANMVPAGWNDRISSITVQGDASAYVYQDYGYGGERLWIRQSVADISIFGDRWNDYISSTNVVRANGQL